MLIWKWNDMRAIVKFPCKRKLIGDKIVSVLNLRWIDLTWLLCRAIAVKSLSSVLISTGSKLPRYKNCAVDRRQKVPWKLYRKTYPRVKIMRAPYYPFLLKLLFRARRIPTLLFSSLFWGCLYTNKFFDIFDILLITLNGKSIMVLVIYIFNPSIIVSISSSRTVYMYLLVCWENW